MERFDEKRLNRVPTLGEYAMAKKESESEIGFDISIGKGETSIAVFKLLMDKLLLVYWDRIPSDQKRKIPVGDSHEPTKISNIST